MKNILLLLVLLVGTQLHAGTPFPCVPGTGHDYQIGPNAGQLTALSQVPWKDLASGDTVRIFPSPNPYKLGAKFALNTIATTPAVVCGIRGPNGERPILDGDGATTAPNTNYGRDSAVATNKSRGLVWIGSKGTDAGVRKPSHIIVAGLKFTHTRPGYSYDGAQPYEAFGGAVWLDVGDNVTFTDDEFEDVAQAFYSRSQDGSDATVSRATEFSNNRVTNWGVVGNNTIHGAYSESLGMLYEGNWFGPPIAGAAGNPLKDRSAGTVIRYNVMNGGSYCADLVEAEDFPTIAKASGLYDETFFYGNICNMESLGVHYGGDHPGSEDNYRKGTLYVYSDTFNFRGAWQEGSTGASRLSTQDEHAEFFNNIFYGPDSAVGCDPIRDCTMFNSLRSGQDVAAGFTSGGVVNLGVNVAKPGCSPPGPVCDPDPYPNHALGGALNGTANLILATPASFNASLSPIENGPADNKAQQPLAAVAAHPVTKQVDANGNVTARASVADIGAMESGTSAPPQCGPAPPNASQDLKCPAGTSGMWTQTHGWNSAAYPVCWTPQAWQPTTPPANRCPPIPPPATRVRITVKQGATSHTFQADATANSVTTILVPKAGTTPLHWRVSQGADSFNFPNANALTWSQATTTTAPKP
jgi:hypothetical protein